MESVIDFILRGSKITANGDCRHEIKRSFLLGRKVMTNLDSILKSRGITLLTKVHIFKVMVFPVVKYGCESWTLKKAECWKIDAFELLCWRRLLRIPWTVSRSNQSILKGNQSWMSIGRTVGEAETPILWPPDEKNWLIRKDPDAGKDWRREEKWTIEDEMVGWHYQLNEHEFEQGLGVGDGKPGVLQSMGLRRVRHNWVTELNWSEVDHSFSSKEQASFNFMASVTTWSDCGAQHVSVTVSIVSPFTCHEMMGPDAMILDFWMLNFKPTFSLSSFTFI